VGGGDPGKGVDGEGEVTAVTVGGGGLGGLSLGEGEAGAGEAGGDVGEEVGGVRGASGGGVGGEGGWGGGLVAVGEEEGRGVGGGVGGVVVGELDGGEVEVPVVLEGVAVVAKAGEDGLVGVLRLAVGLGVVSGGHVELGAGEGGELLPDVRGEARVAVGHNLLWPAVEAIDVVEEEAGGGGGGDGFGAGGDVEELGEAADEDPEGVVAARGGGEA